MLEKCGGIQDLGCQHHVLLTLAEVKSIPDFFFFINVQGRYLPAYGEAKGFETSDWKIKKRLWGHYGPAPLYIWKGTAKKPLFSEVIIPEIGEHDILGYPEFL